MNIPEESIEPHEGRKRSYHALHRTWITIEDVEIDIKLRTLHTPSHRGHRNSIGRQIEPDESAEDKIEQAWWVVNGEWEIVPDKIFEIIEDREPEFLERIGII